MVVTAPRSSAGKPIIMRTRTTHQGGNAILEFAMVAPIFVVMLFGVFTTGMSISKSQQVASLAREAGGMFLRSVDFSVPANQAMLIRQAGSLGMTADGGNGVIFLSAIKRIADSDCLAAGVESRNCPNLGFLVVVKRQVVGNRSLYQSAFGAPKLIEADGTLLAAKYLMDPACQAPKFEALVSLANGEIAYLAEAFFRTPQLDIPGYKRDSTLYQRAIF